MEVLFRQCRQNFRREGLELEEAIKFGACFLAHFLAIHPFINGNGRVASALASFILENIHTTSYDICTIMDIDVQNNNN
ncbi:unnamed protein product [Rhizophagus irregularis]|nr:unnamed protein product [Rhizophagus irregularis]